MTTYIYMNHLIKKPGNKEPVITVQRGKKLVYANKVFIDGPCMVKSGQLKTALGHDVKAWVQTDGIVEVVK